MCCVENLIMIYRTLGEQIFLRGGKGPVAYSDTAYSDSLL